MSGVVHDPRLDPPDDRDVDEPAEYETFKVTGQHASRVLTGLGVLLAVALLAGALSIVWVRHQINPGGQRGAAVLVTIPPHASTSVVANLLARDKVIHSPTVFRLYVGIKGTKTLKPGTYSLARNQRYDSVIATLEKGPPIVYDHLVVPEGFTFAQIAARVGTLPGRSAAKFAAAATSGQVRSRYEPPGVNNLEGLVFPATYTFPRSADETAILRQMVQQFDSTAAAIGLDQAAATLGITPYQVVTVASIVEREAKLDEDRGPIASVVYNRLRRGIDLQIDSIVLYGQGVTDPKLEDTRRDTPYNVYIHNGLPPTPIASPGVPSLKAAAAPPTTTYLYFVVIDTNGKTGFASTFNDFRKLQAQAKAKGLS